MCLRSDLLTVHHQLFSVGCHGGGGPAMPRVKGRRRRQGMFLSFGLGSFCMMDFLFITCRPWRGRKLKVLLNYNHPERIVKVETAETDSSAGEGTCY